MLTDGRRIIVYLSKAVPGLPRDTTPTCARAPPLQLACWDKSSEDTGMYIISTSELALVTIFCCCFCASVRHSLPFNTLES